MSFLTKVKLGQVSNLSDARYAAAVGIDYIGFCFDPTNENYIAPIKAKEMMDWITGSNIVAEFGAQSFEEIKDISELLQVDAIELNNQLLPDELPALGKAIIKKIDVNQFTPETLAIEIAAYTNNCDAFHLYASALPEKYDCVEMAKLCEIYQIIWGLELSTDTVINTINSFKPFAINLTGGDEEQVGVKDFDQLNELLERITVDE
jgi:phosphoribosylanthranilate isomerase